MNLTGPKYLPNHPDSAIILLHGYGSNGDDLFEIGRLWAQNCPQSAIFSPNAPMQLMPWGYQWFPIDEITPQKMAQGCATCCETMTIFLNSIINDYKIPAKRVILSGFSQGCMVANYVAYRQEFAIGGVLGYSGGAPASADLTIEQCAITKNIPYYLIHGKDDSVVPYQHSEQSHENYKKHGIIGKIMLEDHLPHSISPKGVSEGLNFIQEVLQ